MDFVNHAERIAAFAMGEKGGNPAGVLIADHLPPEQEMQKIAREIGYSETAFACPQNAKWRVRYFAPQSEVPFCGHATIALGAALGKKFGPQIFQLQLNQAQISVDARSADIALQSPPTKNAALPQEALEDTLALFGLHAAQFDRQLPPALIHGGANHVMIALNDRNTLAQMAYDFEAGRALMQRLDLVTIALVYMRDRSHFDIRNAFASGGVFEDPATGAAAAAFAGYLRTLDWEAGQKIILSQGTDMGMPSRIIAELPQDPGGSARVSGKARWIKEHRAAPALA